MSELSNKFGFTVKYTPTYSPWSNGLNERNHFSADNTVRKVMETDKSVSLQEAVNMASWTHNTNVNVLGYDPLRLVTGKSVVLPCNTSLRVILQLNPYLTMMQSDRSWKDIMK